MIVKFSVTRIGGVRPFNYSSGDAAMEITFDMTENQMKFALMSFLEIISGPTWEQWKKEAEEKT